MASDPGLRELKKQRTRQLISDAAFELFTRDGFDQVSVAAIARRAEVSEATVFNYFRTKEDLIFSQLQQFEAALVNAIRDRPAGETVIAAFGAFIRHNQGLLGSRRPEDAARLATVSRLINDSPALRRRERQVYDEYADLLARFLAEESAARATDLRPWIVANALIGVHRALVGYVRAEVLAGRGGAALLRRARTHAEQALVTLNEGLGHYPAER
jgi:AcrR family transcriptional regulator